MPQIGKQALAQFIRTGCFRQLALNLYPDNSFFAAIRDALGMPYPQSPRPGLRQIQAAGDAWQAEKLHDLTETFGAAAIIGSVARTRSGQRRYSPYPLDGTLTNIVPTRFVVEGEFSVGVAFQDALGIADYAGRLDVGYAALRPDIIVVHPPRTFPTYISPDGTIIPLPRNDRRKQLQVIDIKMTAQPSPPYFGEVVYYAMTLAGWLIDHNLDRQFVVVFPAVWPGSYEASNLLRFSRQMASQGLTTTANQLWQAMQEDLEQVPVEVFVLTVRRFFQNDVPAVLSRDWQSLEWHVDNRCSFCEYLGEDRPPAGQDPRTAPHPDHCLPTARTTDHLSRVAFITQGARRSLNQAGVVEVNHLSRLDHADPAFESHQTLRATRTVVAGRALSLQTGQVGVPPLAGTSATMPQWPDLRVFLSVDFDIGSAITVAFGLQAFWYEPRPFRSPLTAPRVSHSWRPIERIVIDRSIDTEQRELLAFLQQIHEILDWCRRRDQQTLADPALAGLSDSNRRAHTTTVQFYIWDSLQFQHFTRIIGRHLQAILVNQDLNYLAWLFPPEDLLPNPEMSTRRSPITIVRDAIRSVLAVPIAHYYSLIEVARVYHDPSLPANVAAFNVHPLFSTPLSDQIPSERAHEIWARSTVPRHWQQQMATYTETVRKRLAALETVTRRLETELRPQLAQTAPRIEIGPPDRRNAISEDGQLWYAFSLLNAALDALDVHQVRAMPPHERTARFRSARLSRRLTGEGERRALRQMGLQPRRERSVFALSADSRDLKAKVTDFSFALCPADMAGFLDRKVVAVFQGTALENRYHGQLGERYWAYRMEDILGVTIAGIDRNRGLIAVDNDWYPTVVEDLENSGIAEFRQDVMLDPVYHDFFTPKLEGALRAVGNPPIARNNPNPAVRRAMGQRGRGARATQHTPTADFLWNCRGMSDALVDRQLNRIRPRLEAHLQTQRRNLNPAQWQAWMDALSYRARLIWGPPGTGKSLTLRAIVGGAVLEAHEANRPIRVLVSAFTYTAIDNILYPIAGDLSALLPGRCPVFRIRSRYQPDPSDIGQSVDIELSRANPSAAVRNLRNQLRNRTGCVVVGAPPEQVYNLLTCDHDPAQAEWFDLIVIDEASQMDVSHAILPLCSVADQGSVIVAGDPLQLPPIHQATAPEGLEDLVGPLYRFWQRGHHVPESVLDVNYRSNETIVAFARNSGYPASLTSYSPDLRTNLLPPLLPLDPPPDWPRHLHWSREWSAFLNPNQPMVSFMYENGRSSQSNVFEADAVTALVFLLRRHLGSRLRNENDPATGRRIASSRTIHDDLSFWTRVGVVTPHRAQQALIISRLQEVFGDTGAVADAIRSAVDTVERFQGQERDIMIASYTLGDPDQISEEDEFLLSLNRFNVVASRARAKLIVLVSQEVVNHLSHDLDVLRDSRLLKLYVEMFCNLSRPMILGCLIDTTLQSFPGTFRWRQR